MIAVLDYGTGNLHSVKRALDRIEVSSFVASTAGDIERADKLILPGIGHFGTAMSSLAATGLRDVLDEAVLTKRKPVLGICLGMELMAKTSAEGGGEGLGWLNAEAVKFEFADRGRYKRPHMGWNHLEIRKESEILQGIDACDEFYFAHSFHLRVREPSDTICETEYEVRFPSAVERGNIFGVQFHPEKSHDAGRRLLLNFVEI